MQCIKPVYLNNDNFKGEVPCGKCIACRIKKKSEWSMRCLHEIVSHKKSIFVTLTYDGKLHYPQAGSLEKKHLQLFIKRLRKAVQPERIRYFACGEYGSKTERPHYHLIIFGIGFEEREVIMDCWPYADWNVGSIRKNSFGLAEQFSIQYVAKYIEKKLSGEVADEEYKKKGREPVFKISSLGIGRKYCDENSKQIEEMGYMTVRGKRVTIPRYYLNRLGIDSKKAKEYAKHVQSEFVESITGIYIDKESALKSLSNEEIILIDSKTKENREQSRKNIEARIKMRTQKL